MSECDEIIFRINKKASVLFLRIPEECQKTLDWLNSYRDEIRSKMVQAQTEKYNIPILPKTPSRHKKAKRVVASTSSDDDQSISRVENESSNITNTTQAKSKRNASKVAGQKINIQANVKLNTKLRRPDTVLDDISNSTLLQTIKSEKMSISPAKESISQTKPEVQNIKKENMPPPASKPKRGRKKVKKEAESSDTDRSVSTSSISTKSTASTRANTKNRKDSDVILQEMPVPVVIITDTDPEDIVSNVEDSKHLADTSFDTDEDLPLKTYKSQNKTKKKPGKKIKNTQQNVAKNKEDNVLQNVSKNSLLNSTHVIEKSSSTLNETHVISKDNEAILKTQNGIKNSIVVLEKLNETITVAPKNSIVEKTGIINCAVVIEKMNETVILPPKNNAIIDQTIVLSKDNDNHWKKGDVPLSVDNLLTDDEDSIVKATPEKKSEPVRKGTKTKQMFSPYSNSPVKKRVAAFEKLVANDVPTRVTRTKTRNLKDKENQAQIESSTKIPAKSKYMTPNENKKLTSLIPQSDTKVYRQVGKITTLATKSASAAKPSRAEMQLRREEEQKKRFEKEEEVKRKREAIMQAKAEEQRKKREEKQIKAQKAREEMEREKEEKLRAMQEKEEEQQKKRELQAQKLAELEEKKKAELLKLREREREQERQRQLEEQRKKQAMKLPPLPTDDCEDSDSSSESTNTAPKYQKPIWAQSPNLDRTLLFQRFIPKKCIETLFCMKATTPDLREIFETVDERILRRNSSAVWRTPPRYSTLPKF